MPSIELRRVRHGASAAELERTLNRLIDRDLGNHGGRITLIGDDGTRRDPRHPVDAASTGHYPFVVRSAAGDHADLRHSSDSDSVLRVQDSGVTAARVDVVGDATIGTTLDVGGPATFGDTIDVTGAATFGDTLDVAGAATLEDTLDVAGAAVLESTLQVQGAAQLDAAVTLGNAAADVITVLGTASFAETATFAKGIIVDTTTLVVEPVANKVGVGVVPVATDAMLQVGGVVRATGLLGVPTAGTGTEILYDGTSGYLRVLDAATTTFKPLLVQGVSVALQVSGTTRLLVNATGIGVFNTTPVAQQSIAADATNLATVLTLANDLKAKLRLYGWFS